ncbi:unnamed protein product [Vicia faba]|uniref:Uncharacterized protein n=1 Tax=Vicia faba TaxID=3906 RepID=A0AAV0ZK92_VICFA|nr:unnamed protein product [Vicia faba]
MEETGAEIREFLRWELGDGFGTEANDSVTVTNFSATVKLLVVIVVLGGVWVTLEMQKRISETEIVKREGRKWRKVAIVQRSSVTVGGGKSNGITYATSTSFDSEYIQRCRFYAKGWNEHYLSKSLRQVLQKEMNSRSSIFSLYASSSLSFLSVSVMSPWRCDTCLAKLPVLRTYCELF